jgi:arylformamidase
MRPDRPIVIVLSRIWEDTHDPDTTAQALRLGNVLKDAGLPATVFGAKETTHTKINADLGKPDDPATQTLFEFLEKTLKK